MNGKSKAPQKQAILFTCEHGGNQIPKKYAARFAGYAELLKSHRGWDRGALATAKHFPAEIDSTFFFSEISRLLVELNRSERHPSLFSKLVPPPTALERAEILETYYRPFRRQVFDWLTAQAKRGVFVWHLSFHSFTPELNGEIRNAEIGLLYDPSRTPELLFCRRWRTALIAEFPEFRVRMNYPYLGKSDGHTSALRKQFSAKQYAGIELEVNHRLFQQPTSQVRKLIVGLCRSYPASRWPELPS